MAHDCPGNVRHLQNVLERVCVFSGGGEITARQVRAALEADGAPAIATRIGIFAEDISSVLGVDASAVPVLRRVVLPACRPLLARRAGRLLGRLPDCRQGNVAHAGRVRAVQDSCGPGASGLQHKRGRARLGVDRRLLVRKARKYGLLPMRRHLREPDA